MAKQVGLKPVKMTKAVQKEIIRMWRQANVNHQLVEGQHIVHLTQKDRKRAMAAMEQAQEGRPYNEKDLAILMMNQDEYDEYRTEQMKLHQMEQAQKRELKNARKKAKQAANAQNLPLNVEGLD